MAVPSLAFPCGQPPGFDPNHPAAAKALFSGVSLGGNFINLSPGAVTPARGTVAGSPTAKLSLLGPSTLFVANAAVQFAFPNTNYTNYTLAAIINWLGTNAASQDILGTDATAASGGSGTNLALGSTGIPTIRFGSGAAASTLPALVANASYFIAVSGVSASGFNIIYTRLDTGQVFSQFVSTALTTGTNTTLSVGNLGDVSHFFNGSVAAAMYSNTFLSLPQLNQWALDPWAYWYH
jgi:hypothetical protein